MFIQLEERLQCFLFFNKFNHKTYFLFNLKCNLYAYTLRIHNNTSDTFLNDGTYAIHSSIASFKKYFIHFMNIYQISIFQPQKCENDGCNRR